jgi:hypothetical protein
MEVNTPETHACAAVVRKLGRMRETFKSVSCNHASGAASTASGRQSAWLAGKQSCT